MKPTRNVASVVSAIVMLGIVTPAQAQFGGSDGMQQMEQFAPLLEMMKKRMGKKRFGHLMQAVGPIAEQMMSDQGSGGMSLGGLGGLGHSGGFGAIGGAGGLGGHGGFGGQNFDIGQMSSLINAETITGLIQAFGPIEGPRRGSRSRGHRVRR